MAARSEKRVEQAKRRLGRLAKVGQEQIVAAAQALDVLAPRAPLRLRTGFVYRPHDPGAADYSDRRVPPSAARPPATRLLSPTGSALRLELIALGVAQRHRAGSEFRNSLPLGPGYGPEATPAWAELITTPAEYASLGNHRATPLDKRKRSLAAALDTLRTEGLVDFPRESEARGKREGFLLMDERAVSPTAALTYRVPTGKEPSFSMPPGFLHNGWVHVLEDSEIALLMMVLCGIGSLPSPENWVAIPAEERLLNYGISRDAFSAAHPVLSEMGLIEVESVARHQDGRAIDFAAEGASLHRLRLVAGGFEQGAYETANDALTRLSLL